mgnify:CR=1 FL=1
MITIRPDTTIHELITAYPDLLEDLPAAYPKFAPLRNPTARAVMAKVATVERAAGIAGVPVEKLIQDIGDLIRRRGGSVGHDPAAGEDRAERVAALKRIIESLHAGAPLEDARREFQQVVGTAAPGEIAEMEQQLMRDGMPVQEIQRLCDLHVNVVRIGLDPNPAPDVPPGHPVHTYMAENREIERRANVWVALCRRIQQGEVVCSDDLRAALDDLGGVDIHYTRKEHQLFPALEKHGFTGPSRVMWGIHDEIRSGIKAMRQALDSSDRTSVIEHGLELARKITEMVYKEERILFPTALSMLTEDEWLSMRDGDAAIGYLVEPEATWQPGSSVPENAAESMGGVVQLSTGALTQEQLSRILVTLPVEVSFVDDQDIVRFYSDHTDRIFPRSPGDIGRAVQNCHPQSSVHIVQAILDAFRKGERDSSRFWINFKGKLVMISYYAVRSEDGRYLGCMEVTQDISEIKGIEGERRLLQWE